MAVALAGLLVAASPARAGDPSLRWRTLKTQHFEINFALRGARGVAEPLHFGP